jgi:Ni/Co efflux regulator RcnB
MKKLLVAMIAAAFAATAFAQAPKSETAPAPKAEKSEKAAKKSKAKSEKKAKKAPAKKSEGSMEKKDTK